MIMFCASISTRTKRTRGGSDYLRLDFGLTAIIELDGNAMLVDEAAGALDVVDLVLLEEVLDALGKPGNRIVFRLEHDGEVELEAFDVDAALGKVVLRLVELVRVIQHRLGRDAANVETCSAERTTLLNACSLRIRQFLCLRYKVEAWAYAKTVLSSLDSCYVTART
jgi:hypothetical protein